MILHLLALLPIGTPAAPAAHGHYVEARSVTVFAGACHYGSQYATSGREALLAWQFEGGSFEGVDLSGVSVAASVSSPQNLRDGKPRSAIVYLPKAASDEQRRAAMGWLTKSAGGVLGRIVGQKTVELSMAVKGEKYSVTVPGFAGVSGATLPDRACCTMPYKVWYQPLFGVRGAIVGQSDLLYLSEKRLGQSLRREEENNAFVGRF